MNEAYDKEAKLLGNLSVFNINISDNLDLKKMDADLKQLEEVWDLAYQWEQSWYKYKNSSFWEIQTDEMENTAVTLFRKLNRLCKILKDSNWEILETTRKSVDEFRRTLPLLNALKNSAMRSRHWDRVRTMMNV